MSSSPTEPTEAPAIAQVRAIYEQLQADLTAEAHADAALFVDEFPGEQLGDSDWDSEAFAMSKFANVDGAFEIYRGLLAAKIALLNLQRYQATLTAIEPQQLRSIDLQKEAQTAEVAQCFRSSETVGADHIEVVYFPESGRAGIAAGSDADWTDASSAADGLQRYLHGRLSP
jgi:hypothetical protein